MKHLLFGILLLCQGMSFGAGLPDTLARVKRSVVGVGTVQGSDAAKPSLLGNGFVVGGGTHAVTAAGVVQGGKGKGKGRRGQLAIFVPVGGEKAQVRAAEVVARDVEHNLVLLRFGGVAMPSLRLGRSEDVKEGELYAYTGYPTAGVLGLHTVTHRGIVSAISPNVVPLLSTAHLKRDVLKKLARPYDVFQLDASAFPGNAGSPLYEIDTGRVVGIVDSAFVKSTKEVGLPGGSAISYAIPVNHARRLLDGAGLKY